MCRGTSEVFVIAPPRFMVFDRGFCEGCGENSRIHGSARELRCYLVDPWPIYSRKLPLVSVGLMKEMEVQGSWGTSREAQLGSTGGTHGC